LLDGRAQIPDDLLIPVLFSRLGLTGGLAGFNYTLD